MVKIPWGSSGVQAVSAGSGLCVTAPEVRRLSLIYLEEKSPLDVAHAWTQLEKNCCWYTPAVSSCSRDCPHPCRCHLWPLLPMTAAWSWFSSLDSEVGAGRRVTWIPVHRVYTWKPDRLYKSFCTTNRVMRWGFPRWMTRCLFSVIRILFPSEQTNEKLTTNIQQNRDNKSQKLMSARRLLTKS